MAEATLKKKSVRALKWSAVERFSSQGVSFLISLLLARLLTPHDYGLIAMVSIFIALSQTFIDSGLSSALVRNNKRTETDLATAFYANIVIGIICYSVVFMTAPWIADFYKEEALIPIVRVMGLLFLFFSLSNVQQAIMAIRLDFKTKTKISLLSAVLSGSVGIVLAYCGFGYWSLVIQQVLSAFVRFVLLWYMLKWRPLLVFSVKSFRSMYAFGVKMLGTALVNALCNNISSIIIGKTFSAYSLGVYSRAGQFTQVPATTLSSLVKSVTFPALAQIQDEDTRFMRQHYQIIKQLSFFIFPLMIGVSVMARPLILVILSEKWVDAVNLMMIMGFAFLWVPIYTQNLNAMEVKGESGCVLRSESVSKILSMAILLASIPFGLRWICVGVVVANLFSALCSNYFVSKILKTSYWMMLRIILPNLGMSLVMGLVIYITLLAISDLYLQLMFGVIAGLLSYSVLALIFSRDSISYIKQLWQRN